MNRLARAACLSAVCSLTALTGCLKMKQKTTVLPDGSGKFNITVGISKSMMDMAKNMGGGKEEKDPFADMDKMAKEAEGFVAFTMQDKSEKEGFVYYGFTGYFDDINKVKLIDSKADTPEKKVKLSYTFKKDGDGYTLTAQNETLNDGKPAGKDDEEDKTPPEAQEMVKNMMKTMMKGLEISETYEMPGVVTAVEGLPKKDGRTAFMLFTEDDITDQKSLKKMGNATSRKITCGASTMSGDDVKAFKVELAQAKETWEKMKAAAEAAKKDGTKPADGGK